MKMKFTSCLLALLCWSGLAKGQEISEFPYEFTADSQDEWETKRSGWWDEYGTYIDWEEGDEPVITSPRLNFSGLQEPEVTIVGCNFELYTQDWQLLYSTGRDEVGGRKAATIALPKTVSQLIITVALRGFCSYLHIETIVIGEKGYTGGDSDIKFVINQFPYQLTKYAPGWKRTGDVRWLNKDLLGVVVNRETYTSSGSVISPELDLSGLSGARIRLDGNISSCYVSNDGEVYERLTDYNVYWIPKISNYSYNLPLTTKYIKIPLEEHDYISALRIAEEDIYWEEQINHTYELKGNSVLAGTVMWLCFKGEKTYQTTNYAFGLEGYDPDLASLYFFERDGTEIKETEITSNGKHSINCTDTYASAFGLKVVCKGETVPNLKVRELGTFTPSKTLETDLTKWYDINNDGNMNFLSQGAVYEIENDDVRWVDALENIPSSAIPCNINNDNTVDYYHCTLDNRQQVTEITIYASQPNGDFVATNFTNLAEFKTCDYNSDGLVDIILPDNKIAVQCKNGTFITRQLDVMTQEEYDKRKENGDVWTSSYSGGTVVAQNSLGSGVSFVGGGSNKPYKGSLNTTQLLDIDFNKDGLTDLLNTSTGELLINAGGNQYVKTPIGGAIYFRDLNNDQRLDYIIYDPDSKTVTSYVEQPDRTVKEQKLISNLSMDSKIWCYDFDRDGDIDILLPFSYLSSNGGVFLVLMENDGTGKFKMHENYFDGKYRFIDCVDIDADGYYDIIARPDGSTYPDLFLFKGKAKFKFDLQTEPLHRFSEKEVSFSKFQPCIADVNNDGKYELFTSNGIFYLTNMPANKAPNQPAKPVYVYDSASGYLKVNWQLGNDKESSPTDLTYALRIGTAPGKGDVMFAHANAGGRRLNFSPGNMGYNLDKVFDASNWNAGKYYIAVQVIDPMYKGSAWSEEAVFEKTQLGSAFSLSAERTVADTLTLSLLDNASTHLQYNWDMAGATIISTNDDKSIYTIRFTTPGEKIISLYTSDEEGNVSDVTEEKIFVFANKIEEANYLSPSTNIRGVIDLDADGTPELLTRNGVYEYNEDNGLFEKIKKIYNTNLSFYDGMLADITGNGYADVLTSGNLYVNNADKTLTEESFTTKNNAKYSTSIDLNNDGKLDYIYSNTVYINSDNYSDFTELYLGYRYMEFRLVIDFNNDGFRDVVGYVNADGFVMICQNNGNDTFTQLLIPTSVITGVGISIAAVADMNNDGYLDLVIKKNSNTIAIALNNRNEDFNEVKEITLPASLTNTEITRVFDFDNNGYPDVVLYKDGKSGILYFYENMNTQCATGFTSSIGADDMVVNINKDGVPDFISEYSVSFLNLSTITNTRPEAPQNLRAVQQDDFVLIEWDAARDAETPHSQMRYNVSVKKAGAEGDGAFVISPMNGLSNEAAIIPTHLYPTATRMQIPLTVLPAGTYEVQVQSIDGWNAPSVFTTPFSFTVEINPQIKLPAAVCAETSATIEYKGSQGSNQPTWEWDGGILLAKDGNSYEVVWNSEGLKQISVTVDGVTSTTSLLVTPSIDTKFTIPAYTMRGIGCPITLPEGNYNYQWTVSWNGSGFYKPIGSSVGIYRPEVRFGRNTITGQPCVSFVENGTYVLRLEMETSCGTQYSERTIEVTNQTDQLKISHVTADPETGKNRIAWTMPTNLPTYITGINVYKEGSRYNDFRLIATLPLTESSYVDVGSNPQISPSRYQLTLQTEYGTESSPCAPHQSVHTMVNRGMNANSWNLIWNKYEGATVNNYRILRGNSPNNLAVIAEVSGNTGSYSDLNAPADAIYYALEVDMLTNASDTRAHERMATMNTIAPRSNVVNVKQAANVIFGESLYIYVMENEAELNDEQRVLHLSAEIYPLTATYRNVNWSIVSGNDIATISPSGVLTAIGNKDGKIVVRATTIDGSAVYEEIEIDAINLTSAVEEESISIVRSLLIYPSPAINEIHIKGITQAGKEALVSIVSVNGLIVYQEKTSEEELTVQCGHFPNGVYIVRVISEEGMTHKQFIKK